MLHSTGRIDSEISSKIGVAKQEFRALSQIWSHANITKRRKLQLYRSLVLSKLLYGLQTVWLSKGLRQRIDAFHCSCIRRILGIAHSYISRVTNADVLRQGNMMPLNKILLQQQLLYYGRLQRMPNHPAQSLMDTQIGKRRRGRPYLSWVVEVRKHVESITRDSAVISNEKQWRKVVSQYCFS